jgi:WD40 repeat protein
MMAPFAKLIALALFIALNLMFGVKNRTGGDEQTARADRFGDPLPKDALVRVGAMPFRVEGYVKSVAFSSDGKWLAAGDYSGLVYLWEVASGKVIRQIDAGKRSPVVFFSHDGKSLGMRSAQGDVQLWVTDTGRRQASFQRQPRGNEYYHEQLLLKGGLKQFSPRRRANFLRSHYELYVLSKSWNELARLARANS